MFKSIIKKWDSFVTKSICNHYKIEYWVLNEETDLIDSKFHVFLDDKGLKTMPLGFGKVQGDFTCRYNKLKSLIGGPKSVDGIFNCRDNKLTD